MATGDLCGYDDVLKYVPGYTGSSADDVLLALITAESDLINQASGRELTPTEETQPASRRFPIDDAAAKLRVIPVGDMNGEETIVVKLVNADGTLGDTITSGAVVKLYDGKLAPTASWEPVTALSFPYAYAGSPFLYAPDVLVQRYIEVTATWGFPSIPPSIREACAQRVIIRYLTDAAAAGTDLANAIQESNLDLAGMFNRSQEAIDALTGGPAVFA